MILLCVVMLVWIEHYFLGKCIFVCAKQILHYKEYFNFFSLFPFTSFAAFTFHSRAPCSLLSLFKWNSAFYCFISNFILFSSIVYSFFFYSFFLSFLFPFGRTKPFALNSVEMKRMERTKRAKWAHRI